MAALQTNSTKFSGSQTDPSATLRTGFGNQKKKYIFLKRWLAPTAIFLLALMVRVPALGQFVTVDEPFWVDRSRVFTAGLLFGDYECPALARDGRTFASQGWGCTFQTAHPGVTTMWGGGLGLLIHYWQAVRSTGVDLRVYLENLATDPLDRTLIAPTRWPLVIIASVFIPVFYGLLARLLSERIALIAALLLALNPFHIALSRVLHQDALTATFMTLSLLTLIGCWLQGWRWPWLLVSAVCAGLACLSKPVGWFMLPYAAVLGGVSLLWSRWHNGS